MMMDIFMHNVVNCSLSSVVRAMVLCAIGRGFKPHREYWTCIHTKCFTAVDGHCIRCIIYFISKRQKYDALGTLVASADICAIVALHMVVILGMHTKGHL